MVILDNPLWAALSGPHAPFAQVNGRAARYDPDVSVFSAVADPADPAAWDDLRALSGPDATVITSAVGITAPAGWEVLAVEPGVQLVDATLMAAHDPAAVVLSAGDVPEILDLVARTEPGPFRDRTVEMGTYLGIRQDGRLVALAGERLRLPGWTEISGVCTDPAFRGRGLASRLVRAVAAGIRERGDTPFMHALATNTTAIRLYTSMGFALRTPTTFLVLGS